MQDQIYTERFIVKAQRRYVNNDFPTYEFINSLNAHLKMTTQITYAVQIQRLVLYRTHFSWLRLSIISFSNPLFNLLPNNRIPLPKQYSQGPHWTSKYTPHHNLPA